MDNPYATGVLHKEHHDRLVADIKSYARDAGIQPKWIWTALAETCGPKEVAYVRKFGHHGASDPFQGICYVKKTAAAQPAPKMAALAGALVRNFIRARVLTLGAVLDSIAEGSPPVATCLLIPNFFLPRAEGGTIATWQVNALFDLLTQRGNAGQQTVIYASSLDKLGKEYGTSFSDLVIANYQTIEI